MSNRKIADQFALKIVDGEYSKAFEMLSKSMQQEWTIESLKEEFESMYESIGSAKPVVVTDWNDVSATTELENGTLLYVPIESNDPWSEAISVIVDAVGKIIEVEFGRP